MSNGVATRNGRRADVPPIGMLDPFGALSEEEAVALDRALPLVRWGRAEAMPEQVGRPDQLLIVRAGLLISLVANSTGGEVAVNVLGPGALVPAFRSAEPPAVQPLEDSWVTPVPAKVLNRLMAQAPSVGMCLIAALGAQLEEAARVAATFSELRVEDRLMATFLRVAAHRGIVTAGGVDVGLRLTHAEWARLVGASREAVTASLIRMRRRGDISCDDRRVVLPLETALPALSSELG